MDEQKTEKEKETQARSQFTDADRGNKPEELGLVERADNAVKRLAQENKRFEDNIRRQEELMAKQALGGISRGAGQPEPKKEESPAEFKERFLKGKEPFPTK